MSRIFSVCQTCLADLEVYRTRTAPDPSQGLGWKSRGPVSMLVGSTALSKLRLLTLRGWIGYSFGDSTLACCFVDLQCGSIGICLRTHTLAHIRVSKCADRGS